VIELAIVSVAGGLGCGARYLISQLANRPGWPWGTLIVNVVGSLLMAFILELSLRIISFPPNLRLALTTGFLGGFTTYSSFNYESSSLVLDGEVGRGLANVAVTLIGCALAGLLGMWLARRIA
jgi:fluoride exporter